MTARSHVTAGRAWGFARRLGVAVAVCLLAAATLRAEQVGGSLTGLRLDEALTRLQRQGLRVIFTTELVAPGMRVSTEPRGASPRARLEELLSPHGLGAVEGPGGTMLVVRKSKPRADRPRRSGSSVGSTPPAPETTPPDSSNDATYRERVVVTAEAEPTADLAAGPDRRLDAAGLRLAAGHLADDPVRALQTLPGVAAGGDFRSDLSVRASAPRHATVVVDGVPAPWLQHAAVGRADTGTLTMIGGDVLEEATLHVGGYVRRDSSQIGPQASLRLREGSRAAPRFAAAAGRSISAFTGEGPIGSSGRGSWILAVRKSHTEWPLGRSDHQRTVFGVGDLQSKLVYDVAPTQQASLAIVAGRSNIERDDPNGDGLGDGLNDAALVTMAWRSILGARTVIRQQASFLAHEYVNHDSIDRRVTSEGTDQAAGYRLDIARAVLRGVVETGVQVRQVQGSRVGTLVSGVDPGSGPVGPKNDDVRRAWLERSGYASLQWSPAPGLTLRPGVRVSGSSLHERSAVDRWLQAEWVPHPRWLLHGSMAVAHQLADLDRSRGWTGAPALRPERARLFELGVSHHLADAVRVGATLYARHERDGLRQPDVLPRLVGNTLTVVGPQRFENALTGSARGVELLAAGSSRAGAAWWASYGFGVARYRDVERGESFRADFDQRHTVSLSASTPLGSATRLGLTVRAGSGTPVPGYFAVRDGWLFAGEQRNLAQLAPYARLDVRAERTLRVAGRGVSLVAEVVNLLDRSNDGLTSGGLVRESGEAVGVVDRLFPRLVTAGLRFEF